MHATDTEAWLIASLTPGLGSPGILRLCQRYGALRLALAQPVEQLAGHIGLKAAQALKSGKGAARCQQALNWARQTDTRFLLTLIDEDYPLQLAASYRPPTLLFAEGRRELLAQPMIAIVGSRNARPQACATAEDLASGLAQQGYTIVSGLASGIDLAAHRGALRHAASTVAVVGTGIDRVYPRASQQLAIPLRSQGLMLSEFALGAPPLAQHFPQRNRIIAGLAQACLVVAAHARSGSLITARLALEAGREVMAIPGSIHNPQSYGCHQLIKQGALLVESIDDILSELAPRCIKTSAPPTTLKTSLETRLPAESFTLDELSSKLGLTVTELYAMLLQLELEGRVAPLPGGRFQRVERLP